ncbi:MAG: hypothetical protein DI547_01635 [Sphingobium sp.]|jgi:hypothetical protein|nr:MAG: hypothetical protein DI547_01635 [Sphingobium sp.]
MKTKGIIRSIRNIALAAGAAVAVLAPVAAQAHDNGRHRGWERQARYDRGYDRGYGRGYYESRRDDRRHYRGRSCKSGGTTGLLLGGVAGALLGREVDRYGDRTPGTVIGAGAGALLGREVDRSSRC